MRSGFISGPILPVMGIKKPNARTVPYRTKTTDGSVLATYTVNHIRTATENHTLL